MESDYSAFKSIAVFMVDETLILKNNNDNIVVCSCVLCNDWINDELTKLPQNTRGWNECDKALVMFTDQCRWIPNEHQNVNDTWFEKVATNLFNLW